ncbi:MAG: hypothetical protein D4R65_11930 [Verrucomicrobiaceae bacterium]|nr:MAG: hypothetical protein D4R65_11930 [Verrucomicrobiaceae bacterium]
METKTKTFDAVDESRKWREATSLKLDAMTASERIAYLRTVGERYASEYLSRPPKPALETAAAS